METAGLDRYLKLL